jgi:ABC-type transport system involved in multi-copper enzyme maturation permease subunit
MELIRHEVYKIFRQKVIYIAFIVFAALNTMQFFDGLTTHDELRELYRTMGNEVTDEKIAWASQFKREFDEKHAQKIPMSKEWWVKSQYAGDIINTLRIKKMYEEDGSRLEEQLSATKYQSDQDYEYKVMKLTLETLKKVGYKDEVHFVHGWRNIIKFNSHVGFYFIGALVIIGLANVYSQEYSTRMDSLIFSSKHGRRRIILAKFIAIVIYCSAVTLAFAIKILSLNGYYYGFSGWNAPFKTMNYQTPSFAGDIWQFYAMQQLYVVFGSIVLGLLVAFLSSLTRQPMIPAFIVGIVFMLRDVEKMNINIGIFESILSLVFKYTEFIEMDRLGSYYGSTYNFFGTPLLYHHYVLLMMIPFCVFSCLCIYFNVRRRQVI